MFNQNNSPEQMLHDAADAALPAVSVSSDTGAPMDPAEAAALSELAQLESKNSNPMAVVAMLVMTMVLFVMAQASDGQGLKNVSYLLMIVPILLIHELGHFVTMRIFGYKNIKMFFIPMFGAAVSGKHYNVPGWKKAVVSLSGPLPSILLGATAVAVCRACGIPNDSWMVRAANLALILNVLNLVPILPFDGGWVAHAVLFSRHYVLDVAFRLVAAAGLIILGFSLKGSMLQYIGFAMLLGLPNALITTSMVNRLRKEGFAPPSGDGQTVPIEAARTIFAHLPPSSRKLRKGSGKYAARLIFNAFEALNARPPRWPASLGLMAVHGGAFVFACVVLVIGLLPSNFGAMVHLPTWPLDPNSVTSSGKMASDDYQTVVANFRNVQVATAAWNDAVKLTQTAGAATRFGQTVLVSLPPGEATVQQQCIARWQKLAKECFVEGPQYVASLSITCRAPSEEVAGKIAGEAMDYLWHCDMRLIPPWAPPADWPSDRRKRETQARLVLRKILAQGKPDAETSKLYEEMGAAFKKRDQAEQTRLREKMAQLFEQATRERCRQAKADFPDSPVPGKYEALAGERDHKKRMDRLAAEIGPLLGLWPQDKPASTLAREGYFTSQKEQITCNFIAFKHCDAGLPALIRWLTEQGCTDFKYSLRRSSADAGAEEDL